MDEEIIIPKNTITITCTNCGDRIQLPALTQVYECLCGDIIYLQNQYRQKDIEDGL